MIIRNKRKVLEIGKNEIRVYKEGLLKDKTLYMITPLVSKTMYVIDKRQCRVVTIYYDKGTDILELEKWLNYFNLSDIEFMLRLGYIRIKMPFGGRIYRGE